MGDDREEIARIMSRIEEEREKAASYPLGDPMCSRHGGIRDGLKEALEIILARQGPGPGEAVAWRATGPETTLTKSEAELIEILTKAVKSFPSDVEPDDTPTDLAITVKQACELRETIRNLSRERYWRQWERNAAKALATTPTREA